MPDGNSDEMISEWMTSSYTLFLAHVVVVLKIFFTNVEMKPKETPVNVGSDSGRPTADFDG